jgi:putative nucleotidyltransferase with HDIG domain
VAGFPALTESRNSVVRLVRGGNASGSAVVAAVESDVALAATVLRMANGIASQRRGNIATIPEAVDALTPEGVQQLASRVNVFDFFQRTPGWDRTPERFRLHALAVQSTAELLARELYYPRRDELLAAALLHDIGKLVLIHAHPSYPDLVDGKETTAEERLDQERRSIGVDHATIGAVLARRWRLPSSLASAIENHHSDTAQGDAAFLRVADMLAHYAHGEPVNPGELAKAARAIDLDTDDLRSLMYRMPTPETRRHPEPCPLTKREVAVMRQLATGKGCKAIAHELGLSASTIRSHLHNAYATLGVNDRAQAVLVATEHLWI